ncbi:MAG: hypothetical protein JSR34_03505 [Proteobacteria bacterium]|nr:hypothetical protein [Pseudomonadota bacterium]
MHPLLQQIMDWLDPDTLRSSVGPMRAAPELTHAMIGPYWPALLAALIQPVGTPGDAAALHPSAQQAPSRPAGLAASFESMLDRIGSQ